MRVESGPARLDALFKLGFTILCIGFGFYFVYDGKIGYIAKNREQARKQLSSIAPGKPLPEEFGPTPTAADFEAFVESKATDLAALHEALGEPFYTRVESPSLSAEYFVSDYGMATVRIELGRVVPGQMGWTKWAKTKDEIESQFYWAIVSFAVGLYAAYCTFRAATLKVVVDDHGMRYGRKRIPAEGMKRLVDFNKKGWVDLYYEEGGRDRRLRIDNQRVKLFDPIIDALCALKSFPDPRPASAEPDVEDEFTDSDEERA